MVPVASVAECRSFEKTPVVAFRVPVVSDEELRPPVLSAPGMETEPAALGGQLGVFQARLS